VQFGRKVVEAEIMNQKSNLTDLGMPDAELEQVERILRKMDCYYYCGIRDKITVLHAKDEMLTSSQGWNQCCDMPSENLSPSEAYKQLQELACRSGEGSSLPNPRNNATISEKRHQPSTNTSDKKEEQQELQPDALDLTEPTGLLLNERISAEKVMAKPTEDLLLVGGSDGMKSLLLPSFVMSFLALTLLIYRLQKGMKRCRNSSAYSRCE
jgi:hypothetical protein